MSNKLATGKSRSAQVEAGRPPAKSRYKMVQLASLSSTAPITALHLLSSPPSSPKCPALLASGRASELVVSSLKQTSSLGNSVQDQTRSWKVLKRERVHRIISRPLAEGAGWQLLLSGGKEAALVVLSCK